MHAWTSPWPWRALGWLLWVALALAGCAAPQVTQGEIRVQVTLDGVTREVSIPPGSSVQDVFDQMGVTLGTLDRAVPPLYTLLSDGDAVRLVRVEEEFVVEEVVIPFEQQVLRNESLPEGETRLIQPGVNGVQEITTRRVLEDGEEVSSSPVKAVIVQEPIPEIVMVGSQSPFAAISIPGRLAYLSAGNAWVMEGTTGVRRPVVTSGDLDGRVFALSPDREWLLFTRREEDEDTINSLWVARVEEDEQTLIDLEVTNVVHFAAWSPRARFTLAYSTVEPRATAPGWQANNDLHVISFSPSGWVSRRSQPLEANSGGIYGWWGTTFAWAPDAGSLAYARPDGVGLLELTEDTPVPLLEITPLQTNSDWAWVPGLAWGPDGQVLYTVDHAPPQGVVNPEESPLFDLTAISLAGGPTVSMIPEVGMFAYPVPSPPLDPEAETSDYLVAYLQSIFPTQSDTSRYRLMLMDRDGSNRRLLFPPEGAPGLDPQRVVWSPEPMATVDNPEGRTYVLAVIYQGNLWMVDSASGEAWQLTGDGLISRSDWQ